MPFKKLILVIGATGAQGRAVIDALLAPSADGSPSPYAIRALTRDPSGARAQVLAAKGVECVKGMFLSYIMLTVALTNSIVYSFEGSFYDYSFVATALEGAYGAWINTDGFHVGEAKEIYAGIRIFEIAKRISSLRHYVWSSLDYSVKVCASSSHSNARTRFL